MSLNTTAAALANDTSFSLFEDTLSKKIVKVLMYCILLVVSFTGNLLIVWATSRDSRLRSTTNILIVNMAVSDLLVPLFSTPRRISYVIFDNAWLIDGDFGLALCKLVYFLPDVSLTVSIYSCVFIALDRFYAVVYPLGGGLSKGKLKFIILGIWMLSMAMYGSYFVTFTLAKTGDTTKCGIDWTTIGIKTIQEQRIYYFTILALNIGIPLPIISLLYLRIALKLRRTAVPGRAGNTSSVRERQNKNALKLSAVIVCLFFLSYVPLTVVVFLFLYGYLDSLSPTAFTDLFFSVTFIVESNCAYNYFIYLVFTEIYRQNFKKLFSKCACANPCSQRIRANSLSLQNMGPVEQGEVMPGNYVSRLPGRSQLE